MTTFTMQDLNQLPNTPEEDEAMRELFEKMGQDLTTQHAPVPQPSETGEPLPKSQVNPEALIEDMVAQFSISLKLLLTTVISQHQPNTTPPEGDPPSLQECVATTLQQGNWVKQMIEEKVQDLIDDKDLSYELESAVENYFSNSFSLDDHVDISAEVESKVEDIAEGLLKDIVQEQLEEVVAEKLESASVSISF